MTVQAHHSSPEELLSAVKLLPAGKFRFVDKISKLTPGHDGQGEYQVRGDEPFLPGHFPNDPLFPGVLLLEAAAQLAEAIIRSDVAETSFRRLDRTGLRSVKILGTARPGQTLHLEARVISRSAPSFQIQISARVGNELMMTGELTLSANDK